MNRFVRDESGAALLLVLMLLFMGSLMLTPTLSSVFTANRSGQIQDRLLKDQYARDGGSEYAVWELLHGGITSELIDEGDVIENPLTLNGINATIRIRLQAELGNLQVSGAEDNKVRLTTSVKCEVTPLVDTTFGDDCDNMPGSGGMQAKYTVTLDQVSVDVSVPVVAVYDELPSGFDWDPDVNPVVSLDGSFPEIELLTVANGGLENIGTPINQIWKWDFSAAPLSFLQDQVREFTFVVDMTNQTSQYCNRAFTKMGTAPHEGSGPSAIITVNGGEGCANGGMIVAKFVNQIIALPGQTTIFTYIVNIENFQGNTQQVDLIKDVLPQAGFIYCNGPTVGDPTGDDCLAPVFKITDTPFDPTDPLSFTDTSGFTNLPDPTEFFNSDSRWELEWTDGWSLTAAGGVGDVLLVRFEAEFTPLESGSFFNEIFIDASCAVPSQLTTSPNDITNAAEYCASYSWPSGGSLVPTYDVVAFTDYSAGWGNITVGGGTGRLESWHVEDEPPS